ncbi:MAG TPA: carbohydrate kinase [Dongiaceae bacterium]|jgi:fructokinase|nr:carbohydrate kinase [Dongiaceae bacterium]
MIICCGEALIDFVPVLADGAPAYRPLPGGSPFNVAVGLGRLGAPAGFLSRLSTDFFGDLLVETLVRNGVDCRHVKRTADPSTLAFVSQPGSGEPQYAFFSIGAADRCITGHDLPPAFDDAVAALHLSLGAITLMTEPAAGTFEALLRREAKRRVIVFDPNIRAGLIPDRAAYCRRVESLIGVCDLVKVSRADLEWLYPERAIEASAEAWRGLGPRLVVVTLGADGAMALMGGGKVAVPGRKVKVVDTVGAGDSFHSALVAGLHDRGSLTLDGLAKLDLEAVRTLLNRATAAAAITCNRAGANPPTKAELESTL